MSEALKTAEARYEVFVAKAKSDGAARRGEKPTPVVDCTFTSASGPLKLSEAFGDKTDLILIHNMGKCCSYCTMWADGINGLRIHLMDRAALLLISPDSVEELEEFATGRGWELPRASCDGAGYIEAFERSDTHHPNPGFSTLHKDADGNIHRIAFESFGEHDNFCPVWPMIDRLKNGVNGWQAKFSYEE